MIIVGKPQQHVATWRVILGLTACTGIMSSQFLPVVHRFSMFWCIHQMYSVSIAQPAHCRPYYLFRSLFPIACILVSLCCSAHALYALTMRLYNLIIMLFSVVFGPHIIDLSRNILSYACYTILTYVETTEIYLQRICRCPNIPSWSSFMN